ncbi:MULTISPECIES: hypothetical protein [Niastella]|uniref:Baseplate protein J-like domain-containing protein n=1 Tax=Niastella soli TaxID=2821487 RepID=A0ABS3Z5Q9_9BACT|nr:hypothetical protein [Niastella soli]MBO9205506.1 hypothetical protein [Niastella soli]
MSFDKKKLYELLPALYRLRDNEIGKRMLSPEEIRSIEELAADPDELIQGPLKSLLTIIAGQIADLEENLEQLYDDQFIETCAEWAVSYIGQLVGTRPLISIPDSSFSQRAEVANTIGYRRRKGTASVIEQLARDVTNWDANVVEYFQVLATTQYMNHIRPENLSVASLRNGEMLEYSNTPFDKIAHTADVRSIEKKRGKYNIQNIGIFLWRLKSFSLTHSPACKIDDYRYCFNPIGIDQQLYNLPETENTITHLAAPVNVPMPISRRTLANHLETYYGKDKDGKVKSMLIYQDGHEVLPDETTSTKLQDLITVGNLSDVLDEYGVITGWAHTPENTICIDPVLGRIAFPTSKPPPGDVHTTFYYGFSADMGGGEYGRANSFTKDEPQKRVIKVTAGDQTIQGALDQLVQTGGVVEVHDNEYYFENLLIRVAEGKTIEIRAADKNRPVLVLDGEILIEAEENATVILNGLLISGGRIRMPLQTQHGKPNKPELLRVLHCTLLPGPLRSIRTVAAQPSMPRIIVECAGTVVELDKTISGALRIAEDAKVSVTNSIIQANDEFSVAYSGFTDKEPGGVLRVENSTIIGKVYTRIMEMASNSIFIASLKQSESWPSPVRAQRLQQGCIRFSYLPPGSKLPRPFHCQPSSPAMAGRVHPVFTSLQYGDAGYCQLSRHCAMEITTGADDEAEMGTFHDLHQPQRIANLTTRLDEYLRFGLAAGIFYAS